MATKSGGQTDQKYEFYQKGKNWGLKGHNKFNVYVALLCPVLGGRRLITFRNTKTGNYCLPSFCGGKVPMSGDSLQEAVLAAIKNIVVKNGDYHLWQYKTNPNDEKIIGIRPSKSVMKMIEGRIDEKSPITIVPTYNKGIAPKAVLDNVPIGNTFVNVSQGIDQEVSVVFLYDLLCLDAYGGRRSTQFLVSPETGLEVVQLFGPSVAWSRFGWTLTMELLARSILRMSEL